MGKDLKRPRLPHLIQEMVMHEPARLMMNDAPITGMIVGTSAHPVLVYANKDGNVGSIFNPAHGGNKLRFIDYLVEGESITFHGEANPRCDVTDLGPEPTITPIRPDLKVGSADYRDVPSFTAFYFKGRHDYSS